jgi:hypothetical protein
MDKDLLDKILSSVAGSENKGQTAEKVETCTLSQCNLTEFVGAGIGDTVGLVIANLDYHLHENMKLDPKYRSKGI